MMTKHTAPETVSSAEDDARTAIIRDALQLFARDGFNEATVRDIADAAGVNQALLFRYFSNKKELFLACYRFASEKCRQDAEAVFVFFEEGQEHLSCDAVLAGMIQAYYKLVYDNIDLLRMSIISRPFVEELHDAPTGPLIDILSERMLEGLQAAGFRAAKGMSLAQISRWLTSDIIRECLDIYLHEDRHTYDEALEADLTSKRERQCQLVCTMLHASPRAMKA